MVLRGSGGAVDEDDDEDYSKRSSSLFEVFERIGCLAYLSLAKMFELFRDA